MHAVMLSMVAFKFQEVVMHRTTQNGCSSTLKTFTLYGKVTSKKSQCAVYAIN